MISWNHLDHLTNRKNDYYLVQLSPSCGSHTIQFVTDLYLTAIF